MEDEEGVISFLYELVRLEPEKAKYEVMLAQALAGHHVMRKKAERHDAQSRSIRKMRKFTTCSDGTTNPST